LGQTVSDLESESEAVIILQCQNCNILDISTPADCATPIRSSAIRTVSQTQVKF
jgi:hypothetical protein